MYIILYIMLCIYMFIREYVYLRACVRFTTFSAFFVRKCVLLLFSGGDRSPGIRSECKFGYPLTVERKSVLIQRLST